MREKKMTSIILPVYNVEDYLSFCMDSILANDLHECEIILIDDGSTDGSGELCDFYASRYKFVKTYHIKNGGVSRARNYGISVSQGQYICFVDPDDYVSKDYILTLVETIENAQADIVFTRYKKIYNGKDDGICEDREAFLRLSHSERTQDLFLEKHGGKKDELMGVVWRTIIRKDILLLHNIRFIEDVNLSEDWLFLLEYLSYAPKVKVSDSVGYYYRVRENAATARDYKHNLVQVRIKCLNQLESILDQSKKYNEEEIKDILQIYKYIYSREILANEFGLGGKNAGRKNLDDSGFFELILTDDVLTMCKKEKMFKDYFLLKLLKSRKYTLIKMIYTVKGK